MLKSRIGDFSTLQDYAYIFAGIQHGTPTPWRRNNLLWSMLFSLRHLKVPTYALRLQTLISIGPKKVNNPSCLNDLWSRPQPCRHSGIWDISQSHIYNHSPKKRESLEERRPTNSIPNDSNESQACPLS